MKAISQHRADRTHPQKFGVIAQAKIARQTGESLIKNKLPVAMSLEVKRSNGYWNVVSPDGKVQRLPTLLGDDAAGTLQSIKPLPLIKGDGIFSNEFLPLILGNFAD